jgi:hypothetical protein
MARSHDTISYKPKYFSTENETLTKFLDTNNDFENIENTKLFRTHIKTALPELDVQNIQQLLSNLSNITTTINSNSSALISINNLTLTTSSEIYF